MFGNEIDISFFQNFLIEPSLESFNQLIRAEYLPIWEERRMAKSLQGVFLIVT